MIRLFFTLMLLVLPTLVRADDFADTIEQRVGRLESDVANLRARVEYLERGGGGGGTYTVNSTIDLVCVKNQKDSYPYTPDFKQIIGWAETCRTAPVNSPTCNIVQRKYETACFNQLKNYYPYTLNQEQVNQLTASCQSVELRCR